MTHTSYAQNFEDVMLWRALGHVKDGFYIDVGAQHPVVDSVSKLFYEQGWRGIHVEPTADYAALLRQDRPEETVLQAALAARSGTLTLYEIPETGLSTADANIANGHLEKGFEIREAAVPCITLADVFALAGGRDIHWLKIDVEGLEREVLEGWGQAEARPWIVVVESTLPLTQIETHGAWERLLLERGYAAAYFDGLNRFYVSEQHTETLPAFRAGPNVFDQFALNGTASATFCSLLNAKLDALEEERRREADRFAQAEAEAERQAQRAARQLRTKERQILRLTQALAGQEQNLLRQLQDGQQELRRLETEWAARGEALSRQAGQTQQEMEDLRRTLARREREFAKQLVSLKQQAGASPEHETSPRSENLTAGQATTNQTEE